MRHLFVWFAFLLLFLGCTQEEQSMPGSTANGDGEPMVTFLASANEQTRGTIQTGTLNSDAKFRVYATKILRPGYGSGDIEETEFIGVDDDNIVSYQQIPAFLKSGSLWVWKANTTYYWPSDNYYVKFFAVHPETAPVLNSVLGSKSFNYTNDNSTDLMFATAMTHRGNVGLTSFAEAVEKNRAVELRFHHALAQVTFYGKLSSQFAAWGYHVDVKGIKVCNVNSQGSFVFTGRDADMGLASAMTYFAADPLVPADYTAAMAAETTVNSSTEATRLTATDDVLLMLPQRLTKWDLTTETSGSTAPSTTKSYLAVQMCIRNADGDYLLGSSSSPATVYVPFDCGVAAGWQASKCYKYTLEFGAGYYANGQALMQPIVITAAIQDWENETPVEESIIQQQQ